MMKGERKLHSSWLKAAADPDMTSLIPMAGGQGKDATAARAGRGSVAYTSAQAVEAAPVSGGARATIAAPPEPSPFKPRSNCKVTARMRTEMRARRATGESLNSIAADYDLSPACVWRHVKDIPARAVTGRHPILNPQRVLHLLSLDVSKPTIARRFGVTPHAVYDCLRRYRIRMEATHA